MTRVWQWLWFVASWAAFLTVWALFVAWAGSFAVAMWVETQWKRLRP